MFIHDKFKINSHENFQFAHSNIISKTVWKKDTFQRNYKMKGKQHFKVQITPKLLQNNLNFPKTHNQSTIHLLLSILQKLYETVQFLIWTPIFFHTCKFENVSHFCNTITPECMLKDKNLSVY